MMTEDECFETFEEIVNGFKSHLMDAWLAGYCRASYYRANYLHDRAYAEKQAKEYVEHVYATKNLMKP